MTVPEARTQVSAPPIPRQRTAERHGAEPRSADRTPTLTSGAPEEAPQRPAARYPWPEPWGSFRGARPRTEYWDVATAGWHSRGPRPGA